MEEEIWACPSYFNYNYEISNKGNVRSLYFGKVKKKCRHLDRYGYYSVTLSVNKKSRPYHIHVLVAIAFLNHKPCKHKLVVNHIDVNKKNNNLSNLEIVTHRTNCNLKHFKHSSIYTGVRWHHNKWETKIQINKKYVHLGRYNCETKAHLAYELALHKHLKDNDTTP